MWLRYPLDDILSSPAKVSVLRVVCGVSAPLSGREIARRAGVWPSAASRALRELAASGVLARRSHGRANTYELEHGDTALVAQLKRLFRAEVDRYRGFVEDVARGLPAAVSLVLFGSEARGSARPGSDTDLLVIVESKTAALEGQVLQVCLDVAEKHALDLGWHVADIADLQEWQATGDSLWRNIRRDGMVLHGESMEAIEHRWRDGKTSWQRPRSSAR